MRIFGKGDLRMPRYGLRAFLVATTLVGASSAIIVKDVLRVRREVEASSLVRSEANRIGAECVVDPISIGYFAGLIYGRSTSAVTKVSLMPSRKSDDAAPGQFHGRVARLFFAVRNSPAVRSLDVSCTDLEDDDLAVLVGAPVASLTMWKSRITGAGLLRSSKPIFPHLDHVSFDGSVEGVVEAIAKCPKVYDLNIHGRDLPRSTVQGMLELRDLRNLTVWSKRWDEGCAELLGRASVRVLWLYGSPVSDSDLKEILKNRNLRQLTLESVAITDKSAAAFKECNQLEYVTIRDSEMTEEGVLELERSSLRTRFTLRYLGSDPADPARKRRQVRTIAPPGKRSEARK